jgi:hypothetical protein
MADLDFKEIQVECYSGFKANERPVAFTCRGERREIREIVDRWYEGSAQSGRPSIDYFKVKDAGGNVYLMRYQPDIDKWSMRPFWVD